MIGKIKRKFILIIINRFLSTTRFFNIKNILLNLSGIKVGYNTRIVGPIKIGTVASLEIGKNCWIGSGLSIYGNGNVIIGDNCDLAPDIGFITGSHEIGTKNRRAGTGTSFKIFVDDGCWIGARVTIMGNILISKSSIIAASALVNKNVRANVIVGGVPARIIKSIVD